jgi:RNA polymerase sigma-70 factor (ECF subfamily)
LTAVIPTTGAFSPYGTTIAVAACLESDQQSHAFSGEGKPMVTASLPMRRTRRPPCADDQPPSDEELFREYRTSGCQESFARLVRRHEQGLCRYLSRYLRSRELAEDVCQRTFLQVYLKQDAFQEGRRLRPWIYRIATNQAIDALRRARRHRAVSLNYTSHETPGNGGLIDDVAARVPSPITSLVRREDSTWSRRAVAGLPQRLRRVVELVFFQGLTYREASESLTLPLGTIKSRMSAALRQLREAWDEHGRRNAPLTGVG